MWGLWTPAVNDATLKEYFPEEVVHDLLNGRHQEVCNLPSNYSQRKAIYATEDFHTEGDINALENATHPLDEVVGDYLQPGHKLGLGTLATQLKAPLPYRFFRKEASVPPVLCSIICMPETRI